MEEFISLLPNIDPAVSVGVWAVIFVLRGLIPARLVKIDGKEIIWSLAVVASALALMANGEFNDISNAQDFANSVLAVLVTAAGAVLTDGAAKASGVSDTMRKAVTLGGRTNTP